MEEVTFKQRQDWCGCLLEATCSGHTLTIPVQPEEEKAAQRPYSSLSVPEGGL